MVKAEIQVRTGRKWRAEDVVQVAESRLRHKELVGVVTNEAELGYVPFQLPK